jgi:hypothetical protein
VRFRLETELASQNGPKTAKSLACARGFCGCARCYYCYCCDCGGLLLAGAEFMLFDCGCAGADW